MAFELRKYFNTSGPNIPSEHYTLDRSALVEKGLEQVFRKRYFTIWAPRQGGKSTYFRLLAESLRQEGYGVVHVNFENYRNMGPKGPMRRMLREAKKEWGISFAIDNVVDWEDPVENEREQRWVLIVDEIEGLNPELLPDFLHTIRNLYHSREHHALKSVILVGVSNLAGIIQDNSSPFNITDQFDVPYFTRDEVYELLAQHEAETERLAAEGKGVAQQFAPAVKEKIWQMTAGQPGLVNGFAAQLVNRHPDAPTLTMAHYSGVEEWYVEIALEKNTANIINKAKKYRRFIEELLFLDRREKFLITNPAVSYLHTQGIISRGAQGEVTFHVPLYKKRLELAFAVKINGEKDEFYRGSFNSRLGFTPEGRFAWPAIIAAFQEYVQRRSFRYFRHKNPETGEYQTLKEAAVVYAFEAFLQTLLYEAEGRSYLEAHAGLGNSDLVLNVGGRETVVEAKIYSGERNYNKGLQQLQHYATSLGATEAVYLVFIDTRLTLPEDIKGQAGTVTEHGGMPLRIYHVPYDAEKDF